MSAPAPPLLVVLGPSSGPRVCALHSACENLGRPPPRVLSYDAFLEAPERLRALLQPGSLLRFESPDRDMNALRALYLAGEIPARDAGYAVIRAETVGASRGAIGSPAQLAAGLVAAVRAAAKIAAAAGARTSGSPDDIELACDKTASARRLRHHGVPTPRTLPSPTTFDELAETMRARRSRRVFVKLRHGSAAAAMMALAQGPAGRWVAYTTGELHSSGAVFASRRVRRIENVADIAALVDALAPLGLHVESWAPKASIDGSVCDLRLVVISGQKVLPVVRTSLHPMTNLHLGARRGAPDRLRQRMGEESWSAMIAAAKAAAGCVPSLKAVGVDAAVLSGYKRTAVLEINAFGDFVKGAFLHGLTPHEWQIRLLDGAVASTECSP